MVTLTQTKVCVSCQEEKSINKFTSDRPKADKLSPYCKDCQASSIKVKREKCRKAWQIYFRTRYGDAPSCECCGAKLHFEGGRKNKKFCVHFDHAKNGTEEIRIPPSVWYSYRLCNDKNIAIWESCNFGVLCNHCNIALPTKYREEWLQKVIKYING